MTFKKEIANIFNILATPSEVFRDICEAPRWRVPFIFFVLSSITIGWFMIPAIMEPMKKIFYSSFGDSGSDAAISAIMKSMLVLQLILEPFFKIVRWVVFAGILFFLSMLFAKDIPNLFRRIFSVVAYSEAMFILMSTITVLFIYAKGLQSIEGSDDLTVVQGLEYFLKDKASNAALLAVLSNINPFSIWYILTVSVGLRVVADMDRSQAFATAAIGWFGWIALSILQPAAMKFVMDLIV
ncbi:MAG TPA: YIP1 family protein [Bacteroidota bacterium]|jgi:hypothetical protein|nr:YIP1 family protein [Bacteroidota bacterium]